MRPSGEFEEYGLYRILVEGNVEYYTNDGHKDTITILYTMVKENPALVAILNGVPVSTVIYNRQTEDYLFNHLGYMGGEDDTHLIEAQSRLAVIIGDWNEVVYTWVMKGDLPSDYHLESYIAADEKITDLTEPSARFHKVYDFLYNYCDDGHATSHYNGHLCSLLYEQYKEQFTGMVEPTGW